MRRVRQAAAAAFLLGCSERAASNATQSYEPLVALDAWHSVSREDDPFVDDPDAAPACAVSGFRVEPALAWLEIDTGLCGWVTLRAQARLSVDVGQTLQLSVSHYDLDAAAPAQANLTLRLGACDAWSTTIPIPSAASVSVEEFASPCGLHENDAVLFHVHNHGQNTYQLQNVSVLR